MWPYGYGGAGANEPEYDRRLQLLTQLRREYVDMFPNDAVFIEAGVDIVPPRWINKRLEDIGERWTVEINELEGGTECLACHAETGHRIVDIRGIHQRIKQRAQMQNMESW